MYADANTTDANRNAVSKGRSNHRDTSRRHQRNCESSHAKSSMWTHINPGGLIRVPFWEGNSLRGGTGAEPSEGSLGLRSGLGVPRAACRAPKNVKTLATHLQAQIMAIVLLHELAALRADGQ
jgi:hypothetical protein